MCPSCLYSHYSTADFSEVMGRHMIADAETVSGDLTYFSNKFIESGFITQTAASNVLSKLGVSNGDKSRELLGLVRQNYDISLKKSVWANKFIGIFSCETAYSDLATLLRKETFPKGTIILLHTFIIADGQCMSPYKSGPQRAVCRVTHATNCSRRFNT